MTSRKERLTVTVDPELIEAGSRAVDAGLADSVSSWVNDALGAKVERDRRLTLLAGAIADYESQFGRISSEEILLQARSDREAAFIARGRQTPVSKSVSKKKRGRGAA